MAAITLQELIDAQVDAQVLEDVANGAADLNGTGLVPTRLGGPVKTLKKAIADLVVEIEHVDAQAENTRVGQGSLIALTDGQYNTALGTNALPNLTSGDQNVSVGDFSLQALVTGSHNTAVGQGALSQATGSDNTAVGRGAGDVVTTGQQNTYLGCEAGGNAGTQSASASNCIAIGYLATTTKSNQAVIGSSSITETVLFGDLRGGYAGAERVFNDHGDNNFLLAGAGPADPVATFGATGCLAIGKNAMGNRTAGGASVAIGNGSMLNALGNDHTAIGVDTLQNAGAATVGCSAGGRNSLKAMTTGSNNTGWGDTSLALTTTGDFNTGVGYAAGWKNIDGDRITALGVYTSAYHQHSSRIVAIGYQAMAGVADEGGVDTVSDNVAIGDLAGYRTNGPQSVFIGSEAGQNYVGTDGKDVKIGWRGGQRLTGGQRNVYVGWQSGENPLQKVDAINSTAIGADSYCTEDNQVSIGNDDVEKVVLAGVVFPRAKLLLLAA